MVRKIDLAPLQGLTYSQMRYWVDDHCDVAVASAMLPEGYDGYYDDSEQAILIDWRLTYAQKRCALVHELVHWSHRDTSCDGWLRVKCERRTRRETAGILVDTDAYGTAERMFEGDVHLIAEELEITPGVVRDYRGLVLAGPLFR